MLIPYSLPGQQPYICQNTESPYSIADGTLIIQNDLIISRSGFQKIRNGGRLPKQYQVKQWKRNSSDAPVIRVDGRHAFWNNTIYIRIASV